MKKILFFIIIYNCAIVSAQTTIDSLTALTLNEVILIGTSSLEYQKQTKPLASLDEYLEQSDKINMIRRGNYAWEPTINGMATDRTLITIDGMQLFGACTDKMDPVTSYVEISNLQEAHITSGQQGTENGATIGGSLDLKRKKSDFKNLNWKGNLDSGYETNGDIKIYSLGIDHSAKKRFATTNFMYRNANNYIAGNGKEILYSQYTKYNFSTIMGFRINEKRSMEASAIIDEANDIGYPALPMDVSLAKALITSLSYIHTNGSPIFKHWETKFYYNTITHKMDDSKRPDIPIRMDMPGWSTTYGFYSKIQGEKNKHQFLINLNSFYNKSKAEMTMYPNNPNEKVMFMLTWPDIGTSQSGTYIEDRITLQQNKTLQLSSRIGFQNTTILDNFGLNSLQIFYPDLSKTKQRFLWSISSEYSYKKNDFEYLLSAGYGERAPSISEGYGFYLFNSFDGYDYIGNPNLKNEKSLEGSATVRYKRKKFSTKITTSYFHIMNFIIGKKNSDLSPMTIGATGVRIYNSLDYISLWNSDWITEYQLNDFFLCKGQIGYTYGSSFENERIPLLRPLSYWSSLQYQHKNFITELNIQGADRQYRYSAKYGEHETPAYTIYNWFAGYTLYPHPQKTTLYLKFGIENIFDKKYSTFSDWNNILRKGRSLFINIAFHL